MKNLVKVTILLNILIISACKEAGIGNTSYELNTKVDSTSYAVGVSMANSIIDGKDDINIDILLSAVREKLAEKDLKISQEMCNQITNVFKSELTGKAAARILKEGQDFLAENASKDGIKTTASGLQYQVLREGTGKTRPKATDNVTVHYRGTFLDGSEFDSSYKGGKPATFPLNRVIRGWVEGLQLMTVGSKFRFFVPPNLAYGPRGSGNVIPPNSTLIFEVELQKIEK